MQDSTPTPLSGLLMRRHRVPRRITYIVGVFLLAGVLLVSNIRNCIEVYKTMFWN